MNYYDLKKQATPGPFSVKKAVDNRRWVIGNETIEDAVAVIRGGKNNPWNQRKEANAALIVHWSRAYDKALEALKTAPTQWNEGHDELVVSKAYINNLIKELENVEET